MRWIVLAVALMVGFFLLSFDRRTDDTGVAVGLLVSSALGLTLAAPRVAIAVALAIGLPITAWSLWHGNGAGLVALAFAGVGAGTGYLMRRSWGAARAS